MIPLAPVVAFCAVACLTAFGVVLAKRPVYVAVNLLFHSLSLAALYFTLHADFAAVGQIVIYSGAIVVLFVIVVALLPSGGREPPLHASRLFGGLAVFAAMLGGLGTLYAWRGTLPAVASTPPSVKDVGRVLFTELVVPFELTAPLLLAAIVGAIVLWRRQEAGASAPSTASRGSP
jgi:NADH-quinone oxidoreductase subunit J